MYSLTHRKLLEMADEAGAIYRIDGTVLIKAITSDIVNRDGEYVLCYLIEIVANPPSEMG